MEEIAQGRYVSAPVTLRQENVMPLPYTPMTKKTEPLIDEDEVEDQKAVDGTEDESEDKEGEVEDHEALDGTEASTLLPTLQILDFSDHQLLHGIWETQADHMKILERQCYKDLWEKIQGVVKMKAHHRVAVLLRGNPGIGKTGFLLYVLAKLTGAKEEVLLRTKGGNLYYFGRDAENGYHCYPLSSYREVDLDTNDKIWFLADGKLQDPPVYVGKGILASAPDRTNYKEFGKTATARLYLPVWSASEIALLRQELFPNTSLEAVKERYLRWGGIPQRVLEQPDADIKTAIDSITSMQLLVNAIVEEKAGADHPSHQLLYMRVLEGYEGFDLMFASPFVKELAYKKLHAEQSATLQLFLKFRAASAKGFSALKGEVLQIAFESHAVGTRECRIRELFQDVKAAKAEVVTQQFGFGASRKLRNLEHAPIDVYDTMFWPEKGNEESIDAVKLKKLPNGEVVVEGYQVTLKCSRHGHGIKANGIMKVMKKFGVTANNLRLYIVTTNELFDDAGWQNWRTVDDKVLKDERILKKLRRIQQFVLACDFA